MDSHKLFANDEEELSLRTPFIKVDPKNVRQKEVPTTGQEFLIAVIAERKNIEEITKCNVDYTKLNKNQSLFFDGVPLPPVADELKPTREWQNIQVADFSDVRCYLSRMYIQKPTEIKKIRKVSPKKDDLRWWQEFFQKYDTTLSCVLGFNAVQIDEGLQVLTRLLKKIKPGDTIDEKIGRWIYAFLTCLKQPLLSDTISIIRDLSRQCATIRSLINPESENAHEMAAPLNLIICIVGHYYRQLDLADKE